MLRPNDHNAKIAAIAAVRGLTVATANIRDWLLSGFGVVSIGLRDQGGDKSAEQGLSAAAGVMHELEEAEVGR